MGKLHMPTFVAAVIAVVVGIMVYHFVVKH